MEIERSQKVIAKRLWKILRIVLCMTRKGISKGMLDLGMMFKRGKVLRKAIENLMLHQHHRYAALTCRANDVSVSFISPREYEFSCSNSPAYPSYYTKNKKRHHQHQQQQQRRHQCYQHEYAEEENVNAVDMLSNYGSMEASPLALPGFGGSPMVRQLRVTDSPFPLKDMEENPQVDKDAEEFIKKFYKELKKQRRIAALQSPSPCNRWAS